MTQAAPACQICDEPLGEHETADCYLCGKLFHLQMLQTADGPDCGDVWIDDEVLALQFACSNCLEAHAAGQAPSPEAAAISQFEQQIAAALQGRAAAPDEAADQDARTAPGQPAAPRSPVRRAAGGQSARDIARRRR